MNRLGQIFRGDKYLLVCVRSEVGTSGSWWHELMTLDDWSSDPWPAGHTEHYSEAWMKIMWDEEAA